MLASENKVESIFTDSLQKIHAIFTKIRYTSIVRIINLAFQLFRKDVRR